MHLRCWKFIIAVFLYATTEGGIFALYDFKMFENFRPEQDLNLRPFASYDSELTTAPYPLLLGDAFSENIQDIKIQVLKIGTRLRTQIDFEKTTVMPQH